MTSDLWGFLLGIAVGIGTNLIAWWILFHAIVPKIRFSSSISKTRISTEPSDKSGYRYRVKFENAGRRAIVDLEVNARVVVSGIGTYAKTTTQWALLPLSPNGDLRYRIPRLRPVKPGKKLRHIIRFYLNAGVEFLSPSMFPSEIYRKVQRKRLLLEDLMQLGDSSYLEVEVFGYDQFSGARKYFRSKLYRLDDIVEGPFDRDGLDVIPKPAEVEAQEAN